MNQFRFDMHERQYPFVMVAIIAGIVGALMVVAAVKFTGFGPALVGQTYTQPVPQPAQSPVSIPQQPPAPVNSLSLNEYEKATIDVVKKVSPSVAMITTTTVVEDFDFFTGPELRNVQGLGTGVVYRKDGYLLTNNHVISGLKGAAADQILVVLGDGKSYPAKVVGADPQTDLAVLKINHNNLPVPQWANSDKVQEGQVAIAIGNPLDKKFRNTVTVGVVSAKGRTVELSADSVLRNMLQTDASINPGNSGGPLLNSSGRIIGINTAIAAKSQGIGFAIPGNTAKTVADQLIAKGYVSRPGLGIGYFVLTPENVRVLEYRLQRKLPVDQGILIVRVIKNAPAHLGGLLPGDIIIKINGQIIGTEDFREVIGKYKIGTKLQLDFYRGGELRQTSITIGEMKP
jgi:serine protease Do